jgi:hypothetical protein
MTGQMAGMVVCQIRFGSLEGVHQSLSYTRCNTSCKREAGRPFLLCSFSAFELSLRSPALMFIVAVILCGSLDSEVDA